MSRVVSRSGGDRALGVAVPTPEGATVFSPLSGEVSIHVSYYPTRPRDVEICSEEGLGYRIGFRGEILVSEGDTVALGQPLGTVTQTVLRAAPALGPAEDGVPFVYGVFFRLGHIGCLSLSEGLAEGIRRFEEMILEPFGLDEPVWLSNE